MAQSPENQAAWSPPTMTWYQYAIVALCCFANIADGFDVVSLALAAPVLSKEWGISPAVLGTLFSAAAVGLTVGAFLVAPQADRIGRRPVMLGALGTLMAALLLTAITHAVWQMVALRFVTGICLGTLVVCLNTTVAEYASVKMRNMSLAILHTGFTLGMILGSGIAALVLEPVGWRAIFIAAGVLNGLTFLAALLLLGESPTFLATRRRPADFAQLGRIGARMRIPGARREHRDETSARRHDEDAAVGRPAHALDPDLDRLAHLRDRRLLPDELEADDPGGCGPFAHACGR